MERNEEGNDEGERLQSRSGQARQSLPVLIDKTWSDLSRDKAWDAVGGLSRTSKMPCHSWGIPAASCHAGSKLAKRDGTVCSGCYALKGAYSWPKVKAAYARRLERADLPDWVPALTELVKWQAKRNDEPYFRWFDSGDLQSVGMLERIVDVARATPDVQHWLPTREHDIVRQYLARDGPPSNLTLRLSSHLIDGAPPGLGELPTSTVHKAKSPLGYSCPAYSSRPASCGNCRACWDPSVLNVSYPHH